MSHLRLVYLESDDVTAVVSVLRELQSMPRGFEAVALPATVKSKPVAAVQPDNALVPPKLAKAPEDAPPKAAKEPATHADGKRTRSMGSEQIILAAFAKSPEPDRKKLARECYGADGVTETGRIGKAIWSLTSRGKLKKLASGGHKVVG